MSREIKFRAWDDVKQRFWTLQDGGVTSGEGSVQYFGNEQGVLEIGRLEEFDVGLGIDTQFTALPLSQFTGLKDKNGVEIYEGDLVEHDMEVDGIWETYHASKIVFDEDHAIYCFDWDAPNLLTDYQNLVVIGNIYEDKRPLETQ